MSQQEMNFSEINHDQSRFSPAEYNYDEGSHYASYSNNLYGQKLSLSKTPTVGQRLIVAVISLFLLLLLSVILMVILVHSDFAFSYGPVQLFFFVALFLFFLAAVIINVLFNRSR